MRTVELRGRLVQGRDAMNRIVRHEIREDETS
jgi:hypothetical protein